MPKGKILFLQKTFQLIIVSILLKRFHHELSERSLKCILCDTKAICRLNLVAAVPHSVKVESTAIVRNINRCKPNQLDSEDIAKKLFVIELTKLQ